MPGGKSHQPEIVQRTVGVADFVLAVGQQLEVQTFLRAELFVGIDAIHAHAQHDRVSLRILRLIHLELVGFARSTGRLIFGIEVKHHPLAAVILQADG